MATLKPSEVRARVLRDHEELRQRLTELAALADAMGHAVESSSPCREQLDALRRRLREHLALEDDILVPVLSRADFWGPDRMARLRREHAQHQEALECVVQRWPASSSGACDPGLAAELVREVRRIALDLDADMDAEESSLLHPSLLEDEVVSVDQSDG
jgi:hypothetical protein